LKVITIGDRRLHIYPTVKGLVAEAGEVEEAFDRTKPTVVGLSVSPRELAEVRFALKGDEEPQGDYEPESRRVEADEGGEDEEGDEEVEGEGDEEVDEEDGTEGPSDDGAPEGPTDDDAISTPMGPVRRGEIKRAMDEPFAPDLMAADGATRGDRIFVSDSDMTFSRKLAAFGDVELPPPSFTAAVKRADARGVPVVALDLDDDEYTDVFVKRVTYWQLVRYSRAVRGLRKMKAAGPEGLARAWDARVRRLKGFAVLEHERERKVATSLARLVEAHPRVLAVVDLPLVDGVVAELGALRDDGAARKAD